MGKTGTRIAISVAAKAIIMNTKMFFGRLGVILLAACLAAPLAKAIVLDFSTSGLGTWNPASGYNNDADATIAANKLVTWYNGGANPNPDPNATFALSVGSGVPPPALPSPLTFVYKDETSPFDPFNPANYDYVLGKYGNIAYLFYIGNLAPGSYSLPSTLGGNGLSHEIFFTDPPTTVPDGGATMALLGFSLLCVEGLRRKLKLA